MGERMYYRALIAVVTFAVVALAGAWQGVAPRDYLPPALLVAVAGLLGVAGVADLLEGRRGWPAAPHRPSHRSASRRLAASSTSPRSLTWAYGR